MTRLLFAALLLLPVLAYAQTFSGSVSLSGPVSVTSNAPVADTTPPDVPGWAGPPSPSSPYAVEMYASAVYDPSAPVEYFFECESGLGCIDSGWQEAVYYEDTDPTPPPLTPENAYQYRVKARDSELNESGWGPSGNASTPAVGAAVSYRDSFDRVDDSDLNGSDCLPADHCEWEEQGVGAAVFSTTMIPEIWGYYRIHTSSDAAANTLSQYAAGRYLGIISAPSQNRFTGPVLRDDGGATSGDTFYAFRFNGSSLDYVVRSCHSVWQCETLATISGTALGDNTFIDAGDSLGFEVDFATGDAVEMTVWKWENQAPPDRGSWGTGYTICATGSGCDLDFSKLPSATTAGVADTGYRGGFYSGAHAAGVWDDFRFGDTGASPPAADTTPPAPSPPTWATVPTALSSTTITMEVDPVYDTETPPEVYKFGCDACTDRDYSSVRVWNASGLTPETEYCFTVTGADSASPRNATTATSPALCATTQAAPVGGGDYGTTTGSYDVGSYAFEFQYNCNGNACRHGQFINGEWWVVPFSEEEGDTGTVTITDAITTGSDVAGGIEYNVTGGVRNGKQSLMPADSSTYDAPNDLRSLLPNLSADPSGGPQSYIIGAVNNQIGVGGVRCPRTWQGVQCVNRASVLTVLPSAPADPANTFRPPWAGVSSDKPMYTWSQVRTDILPKHASINTAGLEAGADLANIEQMFEAAIYDKCGSHGPRVRACLGNELSADGGGISFARKSIGALFTFQADFTVAQKKPALVNYMQQGIDRWGLWNIGNTFPPGASQNIGRFSALLLTATLLEGTELQSDVKDIGERGETTVMSPQSWYRGHNEFDMHGHIKISTRTSAPGSTHLLTSGGVLGTATEVSGINNPTCIGEANYWTANLAGDTGNKDCGDWYGYTDMGEYGLLQRYIKCCWGAAYLGMASATHAFPQMRIALSYEPLIVFGDRFRGTLPAPDAAVEGSWAYGPCLKVRPSPYDGDCDYDGSGNNTIDGRWDEDPLSPEHGQTPDGSYFPWQNFVQPEPSMWDTFRACEATPATSGCEDYVTPTCGDGVCDSRGLYDAETAGNCSADCS